MACVTCICRYEVSDVGQVITGRVLDFYGRPAGKEKNHDHQQRLNRELVRIRRSFQRACLPDLEALDATTEASTDLGTTAAENTCQVTSVFLTCILFEIMLYSCDVGCPNSFARSRHAPTGVKRYT